MRAVQITLILAFVSLAAAQEILLIPDSATDTIGRYDRITGDYLSDLIVDPDPTELGLLATPIQAIRGPDDRIYVSDQTRDAIVLFSAAGEHLGDFADSADGLDNVRGLSFIDGLLYVCNAPADPGVPSVLRFDLTGRRLEDFAAGVNGFDLYESPAGILISDISNDRIDLFDPVTGQPLAQLASTDFPEQISRKRNGNLLVIAYLGNEIIEFNPAGAIVRRLPIAGLGRGVVELGNGNLMISTGTGIRELDPVSGAVIRTVRSGTGFRFIERVNFGSACVYQGCDEGDITGDCAVDLTDLSTLLANFGSTAPAAGDLDGNGVVDIGDLGLLLSVFGNDCR